MMGLDPVADLHIQIRGVHLWQLEWRNWVCKQTEKSNQVNARIAKSKRVPSFSSVQPFLYQ